MFILGLVYKQVLEFIICLDEYILNLAAQIIVFS